VKASSAANDNLIDRTIGLWRPRSQRDLSCEDARQIIENVTGFFSTLHEWSRAEISRSGNDNPEPSAIRGPGEVRHDR
jgi:hypothetical protein